MVQSELGGVSPMSDETYKIESTSNVSSVVEDIQISETPKGLGRKVLRAEVIKNLKHSENAVKACIVHQRRSSVDEPWEDMDGTTLAQTKPLTPSKFQLDSTETRVLFDRLQDLYEIGKEGVPRGKAVVTLANADEVIRTDAARAEVIRKLLSANHGEEIWELMLQLEPGLTQKLAAAVIYDRRTQAVQRFSDEIGKEHDEEYWKRFLKENSWMFGGSNVAVLDEARIDIKSIADLPFEVEGGFMDVVELKRPDSPFWVQSRTGNWLYRKKYLVPHHELQGAIAQTSDYILQAEKHVADSDFLKTHKVKPLKPRGLVVHGRSTSWRDDEWTAFRLLNDNLHGIQIMTFDHLLAQARRSINL
jgi:hypothetical protein